MIIGGGAGLLLIGLLLTIRKSRSKRRSKVTAAPAIAASPGKDSAKAISGAQEPAASEAIAESDTARISQQGAKMDKLVGSVRKAVADDPSLVAGVVRNWLEERPS
jgi:flagellar biosynthesis/type III secretory pathway M-ring protein FliF/YscJ